MVLKIKLGRKKKQKKKPTKQKPLQPNILKREQYYLTLPIINKMFELYCNNHSAKAIAHALDVAPTTVRAYINKGSPERDIEPFKIRRQKVLQSALDLQDGAIAERIARTQRFASAGFGVASGRLVDRYRAAIRSTDTSLPVDERIRASQMAKEPDIEDMMAFHKVQLDMLRAQMEMEKVRSGQSAEGSINVHVEQHAQQNQQMQQTEQVDIIYQHLSRMADATSDERRALANTVCEISERLETSRQSSEVDKEKLARKDPEAAIALAQAEVLGSC